MDLLLKNTAIFVMFFLSLSGWGIFLSSILKMNHEKHPFYGAACGFSFVIFLGGLTNALKLARPISLNIIWVFGILAFFIFRSKNLWKRKTPQLKNPAASCRESASVKEWINSVSIGKAFYFLFVFILLLSLLHYSVPSSVCNIGDDCRKYIPRTVRMLQTGFIGGDPFDALGLDGFGAQEFLHGFILNFASIDSIPAFDSVFCLILSLLLCFDACKIFGFSASYAMVPSFAFLLINPQKVNVASVYSGTLMMMSLTISLLELTRSIQRGSGPLWPHIVAPSLFAVSLVCLKTTFWPYVFLHVALYFLFTFVLQRNFSRISSALFFFGIFSAIVFIPWVLIQAGNFQAALSVPGTDGFMPEIADLAYGGSVFTGLNNALNLFSYSRLFWGGNSVTYSLIACTAAVCFMVMIQYNKEKAAFPSVAGACLGCFLVYFVYPFIFFYPTAIRYAVPPLIAAFSIFTLVILNNKMVFAGYKISSGAVRIKQLYIFGAFFIFYGAIIAGSMPLLVDRCAKIYNYRTSLSFQNNVIEKQSTDFLHLMSESRRDYTASVQGMTEAGTTLLVWMEAPFHLNYQRNVIYNISDITGLTAPWLGLQTETSLEKFHDFLLQKNVDYILWEHDMKETLLSYFLMQHIPEAGVQLTVKYGIFMYKTMKKLSREAAVVFSDAQVVLYKIN